MNKEELDKTIALHKKWLNNDTDGIRANLRGADLRNADFRDANLRGADLRNADFRDANLCWADLCEANLRNADLRGADLCEANLRNADLRGADLHDADLRGANLCWADLCNANLRNANLRNADLCGADLDYSGGLPLNCKGLGVKLDKRLAAQIMYHAIANMPKGCMAEFLADPIAFANQFHRIPEVPKLKGEQK